MGVGWREGGVRGGVEDLDVGGGGGHCGVGEMVVVFV